MNGRAVPLPRCCPSHADWSVLAKHLWLEFPTIAARDVLRGLIEARSITERFQLEDTDALEVGELMVRYRLMLMTGQLVDGARTDPQTHCMSGGSGLEPSQDGEDPSVVVR